MLRRRLGLLLLVLYVAAAHGLPALHLAWHRDDHVHTLGGLRWLPKHHHAAAAQHAAPAFAAAVAAHPQRSADHSSFDSDSPDPANPLHLAAGPAHALYALLVPADLAGLAPPAPAVTRCSSAHRFCRGDLVASPRARAPPRSV